MIIVISAKTRHASIRPRQPTVPPEPPGSPPCHTTALCPLSHPATTQNLVWIGSEAPEIWRVKFVTCQKHISARPPEPPGHRPVAPLACVPPAARPPPCRTTGLCTPSKLHTHWPTHILTDGTPAYLIWWFLISKVPKKGRDWNISSCKIRCA